VDGQGDHGGPRPHPIYGDQFNEEGIPASQERCTAIHRECAETITLAGGQSIALRRPRLEVRELAYVFTVKPKI